MKPEQPRRRVEKVDPGHIRDAEFQDVRVFKQMVGYGFHEYVDRCRTELAVNLLVSSNIAVDNVATNAGFGTTQGLRESVRDYLGLVPSEFRSLPEVYETSGV